MKVCIRLAARSYSHPHIKGPKSSVGELTYSTEPTIFSTSLEDDDEKAMEKITTTKSYGEDQQLVATMGYSALAEDCF